jgi:peptidoglycan/LPS O-acetylase OafA/YrhL
MLLIDCCRGFAALLVLCQHSVYTVAKPKYFGVDPLHEVFLFGSRGVDFFFVLSGFVIAFVHWEDLGRPQRVGRYLLKRLVRVYPVLWVVSIGMIFASCLISSEYMPSAWQDKLNVIVTSLTLLPSQFAPLPDVVWTLKHEVLFYALYALVLWNPRVGLGLLLVWAGLCGSYLTGWYEANFLTDFLLSPYNLEFLLGVCCGYVMRTRGVRFPRLTCALGVVGFAVAGLLYVPPPVMHPWIPNPTTGPQVFQFAVSSALIILGLAQISASSSVRPPKLFVLLGAASYSIYLIHVPAISAGCKVLMVLDRFIPVQPLAALALVCASGTVAGILLHWYVEQPLLKLARKLVLPDARGFGVKAPQHSPLPEVLQPAALRAVEETV